MAYANYIAIVEWAEVSRLREGTSQTLRPLRVIVVSHLTGYWVREQPLRDCLAQILDGGHELTPSFWHPFRPPMVHSADEVRGLWASLKIAWQELAPAVRAQHIFQHEIAEVLELLAAAVATGDALLSVLEPPADEERARRVACPFDQPEQLPMPWGSLSVPFQK